MKRILVVIFVLSLAGWCLAYRVSQTNWQGGPGVDGPVTDFGDAFSSREDINYVQFGKLVLLGQSVLVDTPVHDIDTTMSSTIYIQAVDFDGDLDYDVLGGSFGPYLRWYENDGGGVFTQHVISGFTGGWKAYAIDLDSDGDFDILGSESGGGRLVWFENDGNGNFAAKVTIDSSLSNPLGTAAADFDKDGDVDIICADYTSDGRFYYYENDGNENFVRSELYNPSGSARPCKLAAADFDGDKDIDCAATILNGGPLVWFENTGSGNFTPHVIASSSIDGISTDDLDQDGDYDLLVGPGQVVWYENVDASTNTWTYHQIAAFSGADGFNSADLDGEGDYDGFVSSGGSAGVAWFENIGDPDNFPQHIIESDFPNSHWVDIADIDGDGDEDVLSASNVDGRLTWWEFQIMFESDGWLESSILDTQTSAEWGYCTVEFLKPNDTNQTIQLRASDDPGDMGAWSAEITDRDFDMSDYISDGRRYLQYRINMSTNDDYASCSMLEISFEFTDYSGIDDGELGVSATEDGALVAWSYEGSASAEVYRDGEALSGSDLESTGRYLDRGLESDRLYSYSVRLYTGEGLVLLLGPVDFTWDGPAGGRSLSLGEPYPNPAEDKVFFEFSLDEGCENAELFIYDVSGRLVAVLEAQGSTGVVRWDSGKSASGLYVARLVAAGETVTRRFIIAR